GFSGLNAWQPLGITAYEGEQIVIYVGHNQLRTGSNSALKLIATQYHAEAGAFASEVASLKVGRNEITIPAIQSLAFEGGGALYIQYTGNNSNDRYAVRVNGGVREPVLDLYGVTDEAVRIERVSAYVEELEEHVASQEALHKEKHETAGEGNKVNRAYDKQNCILGATEIVLDQMMLSLSAEQILAGLGSGSSEEKAAKLSQSLRAMDEMLELFYHHKGLSDDPAAPATDRMPARHLNIRYMRMFAGAFMYASGNHIGIEWGSVPGLATSVPVQSENGKYLSGNYFGWGIAHEIGHNINQGSYAIAEVTNNYFAVLAQAKDRNDSVRFQYDNVYKKVTSNT
ncbi:MAG: M60 family metallopeptidase, partial [Acetatifactor sp.]|nr:M60 family metallopeptidase [Acetatifactor sp.]